jgi:predicted Zn-dependent peptidase
MRKIPYDALQETIWHEQLPNGLNVYLLPKAGFQKTYATFATRYGSTDNSFQVGDSPEIRVPDGIAHFLEHKMFEEPSGDIFTIFASQGASANAFTSFDRTVYLFSATSQIEENLTTLIDFVQHPYFTDENVEKEKGIIGQEIKMYQDNPGWRSYYGLIEALYVNHPVHIDIAGTIPSITEITKETLYSCYNTFYHPANMSLFVVGGIEPEAILKLVERNQSGKTFEPFRPIRRILPEEPETVAESKKVIHLPVSLPKCLFGYKETPAGEKVSALLAKELCSKIVLDVLFGPSSAHYQKLYEERLITDNFGSDFTCMPDYCYSMIGGDTPDPDKLLARTTQLLEQTLQNGIQQDDFERSRRKKIGGFLRMMNSPEALANEFTKYQFKDCSLFDILPVYESLTLDQANERLREHFRQDRMAVSLVVSGK